MKPVKAWAVWADDFGRIATTNRGSLDIHRSRAGAICAIVDENEHLIRVLITELPTTTTKKKRKKKGRK